MSGANVTKQIIKIATRRSDLALKQADIAIKKLEPIFGDNFAFELVKIITTGDKIQNMSLQDIGGKALFTKEIEEALINGDADIAVHSMKDVTATFPSELCFSAYFARANPQDALVSRYKSIAQLPAGSIVGTSSSRRELFLKKMRDDIRTLPLRGNVPTRVAALSEGKFDAIILAAAGLERLGVDTSLYVLLSTDQFIPAACQGVIGLQTRLDWQYNNLVGKCADKEATITTNCERKFLQFFNADCKTPIAAFAQIKEKKLHFTGMFSNNMGDPIVKFAIGEISEGEELAIKVASEIKRCIS